NLAPGCTYTVTPAKANYNFTPPSQTISSPIDDQTANFTGGGPADLSVSITSSDSAIVGFNLVYRIQVENNGPEAVVYSLRSMLPAGVNFQYGYQVQTGAGFYPDGDHLTGEDDSLDAGATATWDLVVLPTASGTITNTVSVSSFFFDPNQANNTTTAT